MLESQSHLEGHLRVLHWNSAFFIGPLYQKFSRQFNPTFYHKQKKKKKSPVESESCYILFLFLIEL